MSLGLLAAFGGQEILIICIAAVILFGATKVPQFMRGLGQGVKEFKQAVRDDETTIEKDGDQPRSGTKPPEPPMAA